MITRTSSCRSLRAASDQRFFAAAMALLCALLVRSDAAAPEIVDDVWPGTQGAAPSSLTVLGNRILFVAQSAEYYGALWISDGTETGTTFVKNIMYGSVGGPRLGLTAAGDRVFFPAYDSEHQDGLWLFDGVQERAMFVKDIWPSWLTAVGDRLFFSAYDAVHGQELWVSDGTEAGTALVNDIVPGIGFSAPSQLTAVGDRLFFAAVDPEHGRELWGSWVSDGTEQETALVKDIWPGTGPADPGELTAIGDQVFFSASRSNTARTLWVSDGTEQGTTLVRDDMSGGEWPESLTAVGEQLFFTVFELDDPSKHELWVSDGTKEGTTLVKSIRPGIKSVELASLTAVGKRLFLTASDPENEDELWVSDGTEPGTMPVKSFVPGGGSPDFLSAVGDLLFFAAWDPEHGREVWVSDGTEAGTVLFCEVVPGTLSSDPADFTLLGDLLFFTAAHPDYGRELWVVGLASLASFTLTPEGCQAGRLVQLDASASTTPEGTTIIRYAWELGDGASREGPQIEYEYTPGASGVFRICLTVTNDAGLSDSVCKEFCIGTPFRRGDTNASNAIDIADAIFALSYLFAKGPAPVCFDAADANDSGEIDIADTVAILSHLFASAGPLPPPFAACDMDPTDDALGCDSFDPCQGP